MTTYDDLVNDYLRAVEQALADVPADRREALLSDLSQHIATKRASPAAPDPEREVHTLLELLGDPAEVAAALAAEDAPPPPIVIQPRSKASAVIWVALTIGAVATMCVAAGLLGVLLLA